MAQVTAIGDIFTIPELWTNPSLTDLDEDASHGFLHELPPLGKPTKLGEALS